MNFLSMEYFEVLTQERNFTRAAQRLHMTQQSLSSHIAGIEKELECQLVVRHNPLELTYAGEEFLKYARKVRMEHETMIRKFGDISKNQKGVLRVGAAATRGQILLPGVICDFQKSYPNIRIDLKESSNSLLQQGLLKGDLDLAIADFPKKLPGIELQDYYDEEIMLVIKSSLFDEVYGAKGLQCKKQFLAGDFSLLDICPIVIGDMNDVDGRIGLGTLDRFGVDKPMIAARSHNVGTLLKLCVSGAGAAFCPKNIIQAMLTEQQKKDLLIFPLDKGATYQIRFGFKESSYQWSVIEKFMECAKNVTGDDFYRI